MAQFSSLTAALDRPLHETYFDDIPGLELRILVCGEAPGAAIPAAYDHEVCSGFPPRNERRPDHARIGELSPAARKSALRLARRTSTFCNSDRMFVLRSSSAVSSLFLSSLRSWATTDCWDCVCRSLVEGQQDRTARIETRLNCVFTPLHQRFDALQFIRICGNTSLLRFS